MHKKSIISRGAIIETLAEASRNRCLFLCSDCNTADSSTEQQGDGTHPPMPSAVKPFLKVMQKPKITLALLLEGCVIA